MDFPPTHVPDLDDSQRSSFDLSTTTGNSSTQDIVLQEDNDIAHEDSSEDNSTLSDQSELAWDSAPEQMQLSFNPPSQSSY